MGETPHDIRTGIARAREQLGNTLDALSSTVDVPERVKDTVTDAAGNVRDQVREGARRVSQTVDDVSQRLPDPDTVRSSLRSPLLLGLGVFAAGFVAGLAVPLSDAERRRLAPVGDTVAKRAEEARQEVVEHSTAVVRETVAAAQESAREHGRELAEHLGVSASGTPSSTT